eukprot:COSAG01_NODE_717_length_14076_cov_20.354225_5_plen_46_part_00
MTQGLASNLHEQVATMASAEEVASWQEVPQAGALLSCTRTGSVSI